MTACRETKILLSGEVQHFACDLLALADGFGALRYVLDRPYQVGDIRLIPGDVTVALYWIDRPYTLYTWVPRSLGKPLYYFNIADGVRLSAEEFVWRDLVVDVLMDADSRVRVLDEDELPRDLDAGLRCSIEQARYLVATHARELSQEAEGLILPAWRSPAQG